MKLKGSITIFIALTFAIVVSLIVTLIESARVQGSRVMVAMAGNLALDNMFSRYETELLNKYGILLFDGGLKGNVLNVSELEDTLLKNINRNVDMDSDLLLVKGQDFYGISVDEVEVENIITADSSYGLVWRSMINDYAKIHYTLDLADSILAITKAKEDCDTAQSVIDEFNNCYELVFNVNEQYLKLIQCIDGVLCDDGGIDYTALEADISFVKKLSLSEAEKINSYTISINEPRVYEVIKEELFNVTEYGESFFYKYGQLKEGVRDEVDTLISMSDGLRNFLVGTKSKLEQSMELVGKINQSISGYTTKVEKLNKLMDKVSKLISSDILESLKIELNEIISLNQKYAAMKEHLSNISEILLSDYQCVNQALNYCVDITSIKEEKFCTEENLEAYEKSYSELFSTLKGYKTEEMYLDYTGLEKRSGNKSILGCILDYGKESMLKLIIPKEKNVSKKEMEYRDLADTYMVKGDRSAIIGNDLMAITKDGINETLFNLYLIDYADNFIKDNSKGLMDYELEYLIFGNKSDLDNLTEAVTAIALIRLGCNMVHVYTDSRKVKEAYNLAVAAVGVTMNVPVIKATQYLILTAWAAGETIIDIKTLLKGEKVPLIKTSQEWQLDLEDLMRGNIQGKDSQNKDQKEKEQSGFSYENYLSALLFMADKQKKSFRSMALSELHMISKGVSNFRLKNYVYGMEIKIKYHLKDSDMKFEEKFSYTY